MDEVVEKFEETVVKLIVEALEAREVADKVDQAVEKSRNLLPNRLSRLYVTKPPKESRLYVIKLPEESLLYVIKLPEESRLFVIKLPEELRLYMIKPPEVSRL